MLGEDSPALESTPNLQVPVVQSVQANAGAQAGRINTWNGQLIGQVVAVQTTRSARMAVPTTFGAPTPVPFDVPDEDVEIEDMSEEETEDDAHDLSSRSAEQVPFAPPNAASNGQPQPTLARASTGRSRCKPRRYRRRALQDYRHWRLGRRQDVLVTTLHGGAVRWHAKGHSLRRHLECST